MFMEVNGLKCQVNLPDAPKGEGTHKLPPHRRIRVHEVDDYPACPSNWMHGSDKAASYFFAVEPGKHLWLDFNENANHPHDIAIVMSIQGVNPITGPLPGSKGKKLQMEQYKVGDLCPRHGYDEEGNEILDGPRLEAGLFCKECGYKWPKQNYMTTTSCPRGLFWIDGWRADGESIRGFLITAETMKGIAAQTIGDDRVWAIGIAFFLSKEAKPAPPVPERIERFCCNDDAVLGASLDFADSGEMMKGGPVSYGGTLESLGGGGAMKGGGGTLRAASSSLYSGRKAMRSRGSSGLGGTETRREASIGGPGGQSATRGEPVEEVEVEKLEIGGGAKISQELAHADPKDLDHYESEPAGVLYGNYCTVDDFNKIVEAGARDKENKGEGFMAGLDTGNPKQ
jgi:hypothetical protein